MNLMEKERIGIIGAMDAEVDLIKRDCVIENTCKVAAMEFVEGSLNGKEVVIVKCGMGKVNAGICASTLIRDFHCTKIINTGVAGSLDGRMEIGDIVISKDAVQHDFDVEVIGFKKGEIPYTGLFAFQADPLLIEKAKEATKEVAPNINIFEGRVCSGDQFIFNKAQKDLIVANFNGLCCEMEGAAIAHTCYLFGVPFVIIRAISDKPDGEGAEDFNQFASKMAVVSENIVKSMLRRI